jgi:hypothetical protein
VRLFLEKVEELDSGSDQGTVNTTTAYVRQAGAGDVEICDKYGQFENVTLPAGELEAMLSALLRRILDDFPESARS